MTRRIPPGHVVVTDPKPVPLHGPQTCDQHGPTVTVTWTSGDRCPLCESYEAERYYREAWAHAQVEVDTRPWPEDAKARISELEDECNAALARIERLEAALRTTAAGLLPSEPGYHSDTCAHEQADRAEADVAFCRMTARDALEETK